MPHFTKRYRLVVLVSVTTIAFSFDGRLMMTGGGNSTTSVWETRRWEPVARLDSPGQLSFVSLSAAGKYVASRATERATQVWTLDVADLFASACARVTRELTADEWRMYFGAEARTRPARRGGQHVPLYATFLWVGSAPEHRPTLCRSLVFRRSLIRKEQGKDSLCLSEC